MVAVQVRAGPVPLRQVLTKFLSAPDIIVRAARVCFHPGRPELNASSYRICEAVYLNQIVVENVAEVNSLFIADCEHFQL